MGNKDRIHISHKPDSPGVDLFILAVILMAGLKFAFGLENALDIALYDESDYLFRGVTLARAGLPAAELAPLYAIWYFILSLVEPDRISLYYLNYKLMTILPPLIVYIFLRRARASIPVSVMISWFLLVSRINICTLTKVSHFALIVMILTLIVASRAGSLLEAGFFVSIGALLVSFVRPEYFLAYPLFSLTFILVFVREYRKHKRLHLFAVTGFALISMLLLALFGLPVSGNRSIVAFGQHFSIHWIAWTGLDLNPWTNWHAIMSHNFGFANTIWDAFAHNPFVFLKHIRCNLWRVTGDALALIIPVHFPANIFSKSAAALLMIGWCAAGISNIQKNFPERRSLLILVGLFLLPGFVSVVVIYPRDHYLLLLCLLTVVLIAILVGRRASEQKQLRRMQLLLSGMLMIVLTPYFAGIVDVNQPNLETIRFIQSLRIEKPVNLLEAEGGYHIYLGENFHRIAEYDKHTRFDHFLLSRSINMIVASDRLLSDIRFRDDTGWRDFLADYPRFAYVKMDVAHTDRKLFVRADLLNR